MYNAVGIDVSKGKSTIAVLQPGGVIVRKPFDILHSSQQLKELSLYLDSLLIYKCRVSVPNSQLGLNPLIV